MSALHGLLTGSTVLLLLVPCPAFAQTNLITNGDFESGPATRGGCQTWVKIGAGATDMWPWHVLDHSVDHVCGNWIAASGQGSMDIDGTPGPGILRQTLATVSGRQYQVQFAFAGNPGGPPTIKKLEVSVADYKQTYSFDTSGIPAWPIPILNMNWVEIEFSFVANGANADLIFKSLTAPSSTSNNGPVIDNVRVYDQQVEPYGQGCAGFLLAKPTLSLSGLAIPGQTIHINVNNAPPNSSGVLLLGLKKSNISLGSGCFLNIDPVLPLPIPLPASDTSGSLSLQIRIPSLASPAIITAQAFLPDPTAALGFANTNGLLLDLM